MGAPIRSNYNPSSDTPSVNLSTSHSHSRLSAPLVWMDLSIPLVWMDLSIPLVWMDLSIPLVCMDLSIPLVCMDLSIPLVWMDLFLWYAPRLPPRRFQQPLPVPSPSPPASSKLFRT